MDRLVGAAEAVEFVRSLAFEPPEAAFDAAFSLHQGTRPDPHGPEGSNS